MASALDWRDQPNRIDIGNQRVCDSICVDNIRINFSWFHGSRLTYLLWLL